MLEPLACSHVSLERPLIAALDPLEGCDARETGSPKLLGGGAELLAFRVAVDRAHASSTPVARTRDRTHDRGGADDRFRARAAADDPRLEHQAAIGRPA
jgi:hypothetical protein